MSRCERAWSAGTSTSGASSRLLSVASMTGRNTLLSVPAPCEWSYLTEACRHKHACGKTCQNVRSSVHGPVVENGADSAYGPGDGPAGIMAQLTSITS